MKQFFHINIEGEIHVSQQTFTFKIVVGGAGGVGKTTFLHKYLYGLFKQDTSLTIGVSFNAKELNRPDAKIMLALWDLGGQDRFRFMLKNYCLGARVAIVFFDMTRTDTMQQVNDWIAMFREQLPPQTPIILAGSKFDVAPPEMRDSIEDWAKKMVEAYALSAYFATSSVTGMNIDELFNYIVDMLLCQAQRKPEAVACVN
jgi:small GTP-binding protein